MIISHKNKFIFLKPKKVAGTSVEIFLSQFCGNNDVITQIGTENLRVRSNIYKGPMNHIGDHYLNINNLFKRITHNFKNLIKKKLRFNNYYYLPYKVFKFSSHEDAVNIFKFLGEDFYKYKKISIIRNLNDQFLSYFNFYNKSNNYRLNYKKFADQKADQFYQELYNMYFLNNNPIIDIFLNFNNLNIDLDRLLNEYGLTSKIKFNSIKAHNFSSDKLKKQFLDYDERKFLEKKNNYLKKLIIDNYPNIKTEL